MLDVVEEQTRDGEHLEVVDAGRFFGDLAAEGGVFALECPRDEGGEFAVVRIDGLCSESFVLYLADAFEVPYAVLDLVADAEHHRRRRDQTDLVNGTHHVEPFLRVAFGRNSRTHLVIEYLAAAAGH